MSQSAQSHAGWAALLVCVNAHRQLRALTRVHMDAEIP